MGSSEKYFPNPLNLHQQLPFMTFLSIIIWPVKTGRAGRPVSAKVGRQEEEEEGRSSGEDDAGGRRVGEGGERRGGVEGGGTEAK